MYDAKENEKDKCKDNKQLQYNCICDRIYFDTNSNSAMLNLKTSYVPLENLLE